MDEDRKVSKEEIKKAMKEIKKKVPPGLMDPIEETRKVKLEKTPESEIKTPQIIKRTDTIKPSRDLNSTPNAEKSSSTFCPHCGKDLELYLSYIPGKNCPFCGGKLPLIESLDKSVEKVKHLMEENAVNELAIERKYLPEIFSSNLLMLSKDRLPTLKPFVLEEFYVRSIFTKLYGNVIKFFKSRPFFSRFGKYGRIRGVIVCDSAGLPIDSNMDININLSGEVASPEEVAANVISLIGKSKQVIKALKEGSLKRIRLETTKGEIMVRIEDNLILIILK